MCRLPPAQGMQHLPKRHSIDQSHMLSEHCLVQDTCWCQVYECNLVQVAVTLQWYQTMQQGA